MQILHKAEVAGGLPSDAKPIKTILEEMSPTTMKLPFQGSRCFPDVAEVQKTSWAREEVQEDFSSSKNSVTSNDMIVWVLIQIEHKKRALLFTAMLLRVAECNTTCLTLKRKKKKENKTKQEKI